jgi:hypothetical protein
MDSSPKISFNQQVVSQGRNPSETGNSGYNISPYRRILSLVKDGNPNGLRNFLGSLENASQYVNQTDKDLLQTPLYQAVQVKNRTLGFSLTSILLQNGVRNLTKGQNPIKRYPWAIPPLLYLQRWKYRITESILHKRGRHQRKGFL